MKKIALLTTLFVVCFASLSADAFISPNKQFNALVSINYMRMSDSTETSITSLPGSDEEDSSQSFTALGFSGYYNVMPNVGVGGLFSMQFVTSSSEEKDDDHSESTYWDSLYLFGPSAIYWITEPQAGTFVKVDFGYLFGGQTSEYKDDTTPKDKSESDASGFGFVVTAGYAVDIQGFAGCFMFTIEYLSYTDEFDLGSGMTMETDIGRMEFLFGLGVLI
ncbi:MAG: outer membrane beta-barrel protein [Planctomycetota bacterium]